MNEPYVAAQCPHCKHWVRLVDEPERFAEHTVQASYQDSPTICLGSGDLAVDAPRETMDQFAAGKQLTGVHTARGYVPLPLDLNERPEDKP